MTRIQPKFYFSWSTLGIGILFRYDRGVDNKSRGWRSWESSLYLMLGPIQIGLELNYVNEPFLDWAKERS